MMQNSNLSITVIAVCVCVCLQEHILVLGFKTTLMKGFDPLQMLTTVYPSSVNSDFLFIYHVHL